MSQIEDAWSTLRSEQRSEAGWHLRRVYADALFEIFAGLHQPDGTPGLILDVEASSVAPTIRRPESAGFRLETTLRGHSHSGRVRFLLSLSHSTYAHVFGVLCTDTADCAVAAESERSALSAFVDRLHIWQAFMARHGSDGLSENAVIGLMGELHILSDYVLPQIGLERAVASWSGPLGEVNDFNLAGGFLEVKATARQAPDVIVITNSDQLDISRGRIVLAHVRLRLDPDGATLPEMIAALREQLGAEAPARLQEFAALLMSAGYVDLHAENYPLRLKPDAVSFYEIKSDFPRLARSELRPGVVDCSYTINIASSASWSVPASVLSTLVRTSI